MEYLATEVGFLIPICEAAHPVKPGHCGRAGLRAPPALPFEVPLSLLFALSGDEHPLVGASKDPMGRRHQTRYRPRLRP